jgi:prolipoprotein diacylglyceryltransferase
MSSPKLRPNSPATSRRRPAMIIAMIPIGMALGFLGGLLIQTIVGVVAVTVFSAAPEAAYSMPFVGSLPVLGALIGAVLAPVLYARSYSRRQPERPIHNDHVP